jgi:hypothetical protein
MPPKTPIQSARGIYVYQISKREERKREESVFLWCCNPMRL